MSKIESSENKTRESLPYRKNVSGFILKNDNKILACKRIGKYPDWQVPQGGVDLGETEEEAITRELEEEVNLTNDKITKYELISKSPFSLNYEWPDDLLYRGYRGQNQVAFLISCPDQWEPDLTKGPEIEFSEYKWVTVQEFLELTKNTFRYQTYLKFLEYFSDKIETNKLG